MNIYFNNCGTSTFFDFFCAAMPRGMMSKASTKVKIFLFIILQ